MKLRHLYESRFLTGHAIVRWLRLNATHDGNPLDKRMIEIDSDKVTVTVPMRLLEDVDRLEVQFKSVSGEFDASNAKLTTFEGSPEIITLDKYKVIPAAFFRGTMTSLDGITKEADFISITGCTKLTSLKDVHKHIASCRVIAIPSTIKSNILGLLRIKNISSVTVHNVGGMPANDDLSRAIGIIKKYIGKIPGGIVSAQQELIDADLDDYAEM